jgi:cysteinyl-tRNA synthetase
VKDKILFGLFVILAFSAGFTLGGVGKGDEPAPAIIGTASGDQVLVSVNEVLEPFLADYEQRYVALSAERDALQSGLDAAKQELATIKASRETVSVLKSQVSQQQSEIGSLKASLQNAMNDSVSWQQKFQQSQYVVGDTQRLLASLQAEYAELWSKLSAVDDRTSDTVNGFTAEDKAVFYRVWDKWWDLVVVGTD